MSRAPPAKGTLGGTKPTSGAGPRYPPTRGGKSDVTLPIIVTSRIERSLTVKLTILNVRNLSEERTGPRHCGHCGNDWPQCECTAEDFDRDYPHEATQPGALQARDYAGIWRTLTDTNTGKPVRKGDQHYNFRGELRTITGAQAPHKAGSTGRVYTDQGAFFPSVLDLEWR